MADCPDHRRIFAYVCLQLQCAKTGFQLMTQVFIAILLFLQLKTQNSLFLLECPSCAFPCFAAQWKGRIRMMFLYIFCKSAVQIAEPVNFHHKSDQVYSCKQTTDQKTRLTGRLHHDPLDFVD